MTVLQTLMMLVLQIAEVPSLVKNVCVICGEFGRNPELWCV
jgi:hypothetical protein